MLQSDAVAAVVIETIKGALAPVLDRVTVVEKSLGAIVIPEIPAEMDPVDIEATFGGLLRKELDTLDASAPLVQKRIRKEGDSFVVEGA